MRTLARCPICETPERTLACEYTASSSTRRSRPGMADATTSRCGVLYAVNRPAGEAYANLLTNFNETLGRATDGNLPSTRAR